MKCLLTIFFGPLRLKPGETEQRQLSQEPQANDPFKRSALSRKPAKVLGLRDQAETWLNKGGAGDDVIA